MILKHPAHLTVPLLLAAVLATTPAAAQPPLSLAEAIARAKASNPDARSAAVSEDEAAERVTQARGGYLPRVDVEESWQRGNNPVFVFSSLLAQRRFTAAGFALDALNHPAATDNFHTTVSIAQPLFDPATRATARAASIHRDMAAAERQAVDHDLTQAVTEAFGSVLIAAATVRSAASTVEAARADRDVAANRRDAGRVTDADVLQMDVYLARTLEQQVHAISDERIARARLNQLMGEPLDTLFPLDLEPPMAAMDITSPAALEQEAVANRPEAALARSQEQLAAAMVDAARAAFLPQVTAVGVWELNGAAWQSRASSWMAGAAARINLFNGLADKARLAEARLAAARRAVERDKAETLARLDVQIAIARLEAARASEAVGRAAADRARESRRIIRDRYESGLADVALLLRSADDMQQADARQIAARVNVLTATATLQRAIGRS